MRRLVPDFILRKAEKRKYSGHMMAIAVSVDLIGFTAITQAYMQHSHTGVEALIETINSIFTPAIHALESRGGFIAGFAGDSFTALFKEDCWPEAITAALELRELSAAREEQITVYGEHRLSVRVGLGQGDVQWEMIPHPIQTSYWFGGSGIERAVQAQSLSQPNEVCCYGSPERLKSPCQMEIHVLNDKLFRITAINPASPPRAVESGLFYQDAFVPSALAQLELEGEYRDLLSCFVNLRSSHPEQRRTVTEAAIAHGGYISHIDCTDKGWVMYVIFGAPKRFEQTQRQAMNYALELAGEYGCGIRIGLSEGKAFAGFIGSSTRGEYTGMGKAVNLAARFMMKAPWGEVWFDQALHKSLAAEFASESLGFISFKGYPHPIESFRLLSRRQGTQFNSYGNSFIGRQEELKSLITDCREIQNGSFAGLTYLYGAAGQGKSRLLHEFKQRLGSSVRFITLQADPVHPTALGPFTTWIKNEFIKGQGDTSERQVLLFRSTWAAFVSTFSALEEGPKLLEELARIESLIGGLIGLEWEASLYAGLEPQDRASLVRLAIRSLIEVMTKLKPIVLIVEDLHWLDPESASLVSLITRKAETIALKLIVTSRLRDDGSRPILKLDRDVKVDSIGLDGLNGDLVQALMIDLLCLPVSRDLLAYVHSRSQGNPFIVVQLSIYLEETGSLETRDGEACLKISPEQMPDSVEALLIARIDRLEAQLKRMVQTASVLGYEFNRAVLALLLEQSRPEQANQDDGSFQARLELGELERIWNAVSEISYIFSHSLLRDAAYGMQLVKQLRGLHLQAARAMLEIHGEEESSSALIAFHYDKAGEGFQAAGFYLKAGDYERDRFHFQAALELYLSALRLVETLWGSDHPSFAKCLSRIGNVYFGKSDYDQSLPYYLQALAIQEKALGRNHPEIADTLYNLANYYYVKGNYEQALDQYRQTLAIREILLGKAHPDTASCINNIGNVLRDIGKYQQAEEYYEQALAIRQGLWGERHVKIAASYNDMANLYWSRGDYKQATDYYMRALNIREQVLGLRHPETADSINCMGDIFSKMGDFERALTYYQQALAIRVEVLGVRHSSTADSLNNIGIAYDITGEFIKALQHLDQALTIKLQVFGDSHVEVATVLNNIGSVYDHQGNYDLALQTHQKALLIWQETLGTDHTETATCLNNIGCVYENKGDNDTALSYYERAYAIFESVLGPMSPETSTALVNIGCVHENKHDYPTAITFYQRALSIREVVFGPSHPATQRTQANIARLEKMIKGDSEN